MAKYIDAEEITPIMAEYVADVFSRKEHLDDISYGYCTEIADVFRRYAERAKQEQQEKSKKDCNDCPHCVDRKDQYGWHFKGCFGGPYKGKFIAEIDECPLKQAQPEVNPEKPIIPNDLEEAADEMALRAFPEKKSYSTVIDRVVDYNAVDRKNYRDGIIAGAKWQKEQDLAEMAQSKSPLSVAYANRCFENGKQAMKEHMLKIITKDDNLEEAGTQYVKTHFRDIDWTPDVIKSCLEEAFISGGEYVFNKIKYE